MTNLRGFIYCTILIFIVGIMIERFMIEILSTREERRSESDSVLSYLSVDFMQGRRDYMEDTFSTFVPEYNDFNSFSALFGVFDGHGGDKISNDLSNHFLQQLFNDCFKVQNEREEEMVRRFIERKKDNLGSLKECINHSFVSFDLKLQERYTSYWKQIGGSTAIVSALYFSSPPSSSSSSSDHNVHGEYYNINLLGINVGDSRAIFSPSSSNNDVIPLSYDHKPGEEKELQRIQNAGGFFIKRGVDRVNGILATSRSFGDFTLRPSVIAEPDFVHLIVGSIFIPHNRSFVEFIDYSNNTKIHRLSSLSSQSSSMIEDDEMITILASDGFWDRFSNNNSVEFVRKKANEGMNIHQITSMCVNEAYDRHSTDNITVQIINLSKFITNLIINELINHQ